MADEQVTNFLTGADPELIGHFQNKGWDKLTPDKAAIEAGKAHREAERLIGAPAEFVIKLPKDPNDKPGWDTVYQRLGAPKEAAAYDAGFAEIKTADGKPLAQPLIDTIRKLAFDAHLSPDSAKTVAKSLASYQDAQTAAALVEKQAKGADEVALLTKDWGAANMEVNKIIAKAAVDRLGIPPEAIEALQGQIGYAAVMKMFHKIGTATGEDTFLRNLNGGGSPVLTKEQATARKIELQNDQDWRKRYLAGGVNENREFQAVLKIIEGS